MTSVSVVSCGMLLSQLSAAPEAPASQTPRGPSCLRTYPFQRVRKSPLIPGLQKASKSAYHVREGSGWVGR